MIVSTPVDLPRLEPDDWDRWGDVWSTYAKPLVKTVPSHNGVGDWTGFDVHTTKRFPSKYVAPVVNLEEVYPSFHKQIMESLPGHIGGLRFIHSYRDFSAHRDNLRPQWELRCMLSGKPDQWYYERVDKTDRQRLVLPPESNWWAYMDGACLHGTDYDPNRVLVQACVNLDFIRKLAEAGREKYDPKYQVSFPR